MTATLDDMAKRKPPPAGNVDTLTEVLWAALHGLTTLARNDRLRPRRDTDRIQLLIAQFDDAGSRKA